MNVLQKTIVLSNGILMPLFSLRTWNLTNYQRDKQDIRYALQHEYRLINSVQMYNNGKMIGQAAKDSSVPPQEVFLVSKLNAHQCEYNTAKKTINEMLKNLQTDYLDLCLIHWPVPKKRLETWKTLEEAYREGKSKAIGVSNFEPKHLDELLANCEIPLVVNQVELHPAFCQKNIKIMTYMPLMAGNCQKNKVIKQLSKKLQTTPAQICLRRVYQQGTIAIPKSSSPQRIIENTQIESFELRQENSDLIETISEKNMIEIHEMWNINKINESW